MQYIIGAQRNWAKVRSQSTINWLRYRRQFDRRKPKPKGRKRLEPHYSLKDPEFCEQARRAVMGIVNLKTSETLKNHHGKPVSARRVFLVQQIGE